MIKNPGGEIAFLSVLFILAGTYVSYQAFLAGKMGLGIVFAAMPAACILIWFGVRAARWLVVAYLVLATIGAIGLLITTGFNWSTALRGMLAGYGAFQFATWRGVPDADDVAETP